MHESIHRNNFEEKKEKPRRNKKKNHIKKLCRIIRGKTIECNTTEEKIETCNGKHDIMAMKMMIMMVM